MPSVHTVKITCGAITSYQLRELCTDMLAREAHAGPRERHLLSHLRVIA